VIVWAVAFLVLGAATYVSWWLRRDAVRRRQMEEARERAEISAAAFARGSPATAPIARLSDNLLTAFRSDELPIAEDAERDDQRAIVSALALAADHLGAAQCVLWRRGTRIEDVIEAVACARGVDAPMLAPAERGRLDALLDGDAGDRESSDPRLLMSAVRFHEGGGALTAHFTDEVAVDSAARQAQLQRHADLLGTLTELLRVRGEVSHANRKLRAMMRSAMTLQGSRDPMALERAFADHAMLVGGAEWAIVVRWDQGAHAGDARVLTDDAPQFWARSTARQASIVGKVCLTGEMKLVTDTRALVGLAEPVFDDSPLPVGTGSMVVVPLKRGEDLSSVVGAVVCGHSVNGALRNSDATALRDLGVVAAGALDTAWAMQEATERARTDTLTGVPNRRHFDEKFEKMIGETDRYGGSSALVLVDVDFFKKVNDSYGHEAGDTVLIAVTQVLSAERRTVDFVARIGGEELALLLPQTDSAGALEVAERLRKRIEALQVRAAVGMIGVTASFGVAMYAARSGTGDRLFERADKALYAAKNGGRNRVELAAADGVWTA
jgi:diguanylate cyclase (GGDEF)-like protein